MHAETLKTRTGQFPIGFRDCLENSIAWARDNGFAVLDLVKDVPEKRERARTTGLSVGAMDLPTVRSLITADEGRREAAVAATATFLRECSGDRPAIFLTIMLPEEPERARRENFEFMVAAYSALSGILEECDCRLVNEGWPGPGALCCTPEGLRAFFAACPSERIGVNYDPSHLIRMGIDPVRFLHEFSGRVFHMHAKDTELIAENIYAFGHEQPPTFAKNIPFGAVAWRYTIPGHGQTPWTGIFRILEQSGFDGFVSIELEDANFRDTEDLKKAGLLHAGRFLTGC